MDKRNVIQNLKEVKLVIGNGYDLFCGLKSSYKDYFMRDESKNIYFLKWINLFKDKSRTFVDFNIGNHKDFWVEFEHLDKTNVWDFFFYIKSNINEGKEQREWLWCDIEKVMYDSFDSNQRDKGIQFNWELVYETITRGKPVAPGNWEIDTIASVIIKIRNYKGFANEDDFYNFLLTELKKFEKEFGEYIANKRHMSNPYSHIITPYSKGFNYNSEKTVEQLCKKEELRSIDSFNYDDIGIEEYAGIFHNINGNVDFPIFGIDSTLCEASDPRFIFTKTNRRLELDMQGNNSFMVSKFRDVVIFGHSLSKSDYNYFFPLFDKISIADYSADSKIGFAYAIYDNEKEYKIKQDLRLAIQKIFESYARYKGLIEPNRLLDSLTTQGRVFTFEIYNYNYMRII